MLSLKFAATAGLGVVSLPGYVFHNDVKSGGLYCRVCMVALLRLRVVASIQPRHFGPSAARVLKEEGDFLKKTEPPAPLKAQRRWRSVQASLE
jgi:hypothetical protein